MTTSRGGTKTKESTMMTIFEVKLNFSNYNFMVRDLWLEIGDLKNFYKV